MNLRVLVWAAAAVIAAVPLLATGPLPAAASHSWSNYHWGRISSPFNLQLVDSVTSTWQDQLKLASSDWSASTMLDTVIEQGAESNATRRRCPAPSGKVRVCNAAYGINGWLGLAQIWVYSDGHIAQGVAKMNDSYSMDGPTKQYVLCQEVGHNFGLAHQDEDFDNLNKGSCMDYSRYPGGSTELPWGPADNRHPNTHDYDQLVTIYSGHTDSSSTVSGASAGSSSRSEEAGNSQAEWGRAIRFDRDGTPIVFRKDLGAGRHLVTWVLWERGHGPSGH